MHKAKTWVAKQVRWTYRSRRTARSRGVRMVLGGLLVIALSILITLGAAPVPATSVTTDAGLSSNSGVLPLGAAGLQESRSSEELASGLSHTQIVRGEKSNKDFYTVDAALTITEKEGRQVADRLSGDGYNPEILTINRPPDVPGDSPLAYLVRAGKFDSKQEAEKLQERLKNSGYGGEENDAYPTPAVTYTGYYGGETTGPWVVNVLEVDPNRFGGTLVPELATEIVPGKKTVTDISDRTGSLAGVNGGYFVVEEDDGTPGDLAGISVVDGEPVSEAVNGKTSLILPTETGKGAYVATLSSEQIVTASDGARRMVDGMNRKPGLIRSCGGVGGDRPTELPKHDVTCTDESELILFTPIFGETSEAGDGVEAALDTSGKVTELREERGGEILSGGSVLSGTGGAANWLRDHARPGAELSVSTDISSSEVPATVEGASGIINGGPRLLRDGEPDITASAEGFNWEGDPGFYYAFGVQRNPRTLAGIKRDGSLLLVTVDSPQPGYSVGLSFEESARLMRALGATDALNLDGGGSTTMTIGEMLINRPSDKTGERPISDALLLLGNGLPDTGGEVPTSCRSIVEQQNIGGSLRSLSHNPVSRAICQPPSE